jgi:hypothetical protein
LAQHLAHPTIIDAPGKYLTYDNRLVIIKEIARKGPFPAIGEVHHEGVVLPNTWKKSGQYNLVKLGPHPLDIVCKYHEHTP